MSDESTPKRTRLPFANQNMPLDDQEKLKMIAEIAARYEDVMDAMRIDWRKDPNSKDTPMRVAKSFVNDLMKGCYMEEPIITGFDNVDEYDGIVFQGDIKIVSMCSHHHLAFTGKAHVAYIPSTKGKVIGLSKLNRICDFYARRPQVQENLTMQIHNHIDRVCEDNLGVSVMIEAQHSCCSNRGIGHDSTMKTSKSSGVFIDDQSRSRDEFYRMIADLK